MTCAPLFRDRAGRLPGGELFDIKNLPAQASKPFIEDLYFEGTRPRKFDKVELMVFPTSKTHNRLPRPEGTGAMSEQRSRPHDSARPITPEKIPTFAPKNSCYKTRAKYNDDFRAMRKSVCVT